MDLHLLPVTEENVQMINEFNSETMLMVCIINGYMIKAHEILDKYPQQCRVGHVSEYSDTALLDSLKSESHEAPCEKILDILDDSNLFDTNDAREDAFMLALKHKRYHMAYRLLKRSDKFLHTKDLSGNMYIQKFCIKIETQVFLHDTCHRPVVVVVSSTSVH